MKHRTTISVALAAIVAFFVCLAAGGAEPRNLGTVDFGGSMQAQGCAHPEGVDSTYTVHLGYEYEGESLTASGSVVDKPRGSDCTRQGLTIDVLLSQSFDFVAGSTFSVDIGHDEHGVVGFNAYNGLEFGTVKQTTAAAMIGWTVLGADVAAGWNVANGQPRVSFSYSLGENIELSADCTGTDGDDPYCDASAGWSRDFGDGWGVRVSFEHSDGFEHLPDPFAGRADAPAANESNSLRFSLTRSL